MALVSIVVPVYKVQDYLVRCLDSILNQSLHDIEIILVDDASPDNCGKICDVYASKDSRIIVIHNKINQGLAVARNIGIAHATSNYLMFVDSDDWIHADFCKASYECAVKHQVELVMFRHASMGYKPKHYEEEKRLPSGYKTQFEAIELLLNGIVGTTAWNKLYRKELFKNIIYPPGYYYEDLGTTHKIILQASRIYYLNKVLYYYQRNRIGSITKIYTEKSFKDSIAMHIQQYNDLATWGYPSGKLNVLLLQIALTYCIGKKSDTNDEQYNYFSTILHNTTSIPKNFTGKQKILFILYRFCPFVFEWICILFNKKIC